VRRCWHALPRLQSRPIYAHLADYEVAWNQRKGAVSLLALNI